MVIHEVFGPKLGTGEVIAEGGVFSQGPSRRVGRDDPA